MKTLPIGAVISDTCKLDDICHAWVCALEVFRDDPEVIAKMREWSYIEYENDGGPIVYACDTWYCVADCDDATGDSDYLLDELLYELLEIANERCEPYTYAGTHPDDGACAGVWLDWEAVEWDITCGEITKIDNPSDLENVPTLVALEVNDHGNATLHIRDTWRIAWEAV